MTISSVFLKNIWDRFVAVMSVLVVTFIVAVVITENARAQSDTDTALDRNPAMEEAIVFGRASQQIGDAGAASEGSVGGADLAIRPLLQPAELLEAVPGMVAVQHSGSGKANQYFMRGFNLDHGTDFTNYIDGVPINFRSHGHGQGYLDINGLIPETVDRIDYRKGTYRADTGDFSMAGVSFMHTIDELDEKFISIEAGSYDWQRLAVGGSVSLGKGVLTGIGQYKGYDGPWELGESLNHKSLWTKYIQQTRLGTLSVSLSGYSATWSPTEQIPESAIGTDVCADVFCSLDDTARGRTDRWIATLLLENDNWKGSLYAQYYDWEMSSDPTYTEQINQFDERWTFGGRIEGDKPLLDALDVIIGSEFRYDDVSRVGVDFFDGGEFLAENGRNAITEASIGAYAELSWAATDNLRITPGVRADYFDFSVTALNSLSADGNDSDSIVSPKLAFAYTFNDRVETYANWGYGFHSNDARGVVDSTNPVEGLVRGEGYEVGARYENNGFKISATYWWLNLDSELSFVGDSNSVEPKGGSERDGLELVGFWRPLDWLAIDAVYAHSNARQADPEEAGGKFIEGAVEDSAQVGLTINYGAWDVSSRWRYFGGYALLPDNSDRVGGVSTLNLRVARAFENFSLYGEIINLTDESGKDIVYFYQTNVAGLGINEGRVSRAKEPRTIRVGAKFTF
ncbi:MAG: TonB-dependent receptor [Proteobacteria bacterium]|jgi:outer membrane receptor protein involved in Fe transport|nr:TonB-dependent receptor [Pseudomonadota bacterium]